MPSMPGMRISNRHTSGRRRCASWTAWRPSAASPTTSMPGWASRIIRSPVRTISWSSATITRIVMPSSRSGAGQRSRSSPGQGPGQLRRCRRGAGALDHAGEAVPRRPGRAQDAGVAVVAHPQPHQGVAGCDADLDTGGVTGMPPGVGDRLLDQAVDRGLDRRRDTEVVAYSTSTEGPERFGLASCSRSAMPGLGASSAGSAAAQERTMARISAEGARRLGFDHVERLRRGVRQRRRRREARLCADRDSRDMMRDGVVQVTRQPFTFEQLDLVELTHPRPGPEAERPAQGDGRERTANAPPRRRGRGGRRAARGRPRRAMIANRS